MSEPIRMCIACRGRFVQQTLIRLQCDKEQSLLVFFTGSGRSFYLCESCIDHKKTPNMLAKNCGVNKERAKEMISNLKEKLIYE